MNTDADKTKLRVPHENNKLLEKLLENVNQNEELLTLWNVVNTNAMERLSYSDHGIVHFQIVANIGLKFARMLKKHGVVMSIQKDFELSYEHAELVIFLASILHDTGMSVNRDGHEEYSLFLANTLMREMLTFLPIRERTIVISETLHAIINHRDDGRPKTIEAGIVRVADALDMAEGRSRIPYQRGDMNIHSLSSIAINKVTISDGTQKPIKVVIDMNNSAGIFQVDDLLKSKVKGSGIEKYIDIEAVIESETEKKLITRVTYNE
jgi:uncharacterized protein